jgi:putative Mg2+ transporter-C (MgtC) family protein
LAGAIVRRDSFVVGVTTAATIWFLTVIGLCFGGGQISLGLIAVSLGFLVLAGLRRIEDQMKQDHQAKLVIVTSASGPDEPEIRSILAREGFRVSSCGFAAAQANENNELRCEVLWRAKPNDSRVPAFIRELARREHIVSIDWMPYAS